MDALECTLSCQQVTVPVRRHLQAQRHLLLQQASVLQNNVIDPLAQLLFLRLQALQVLLPKQEVNQEKEAVKKRRECILIGKYNGYK